jgi:hypothetical protein
MLTDAERERAGWLLAAGLLAVIFFGYLMPVTGYFSAVPGDLGDNRYNAMVLEHLHRVVAGYDRGLWNPDFFYPFQGVLAFSDNLLGSAPPYVLARLLGLSREHAFDAWFVVGTLLNFASALYALRRFGLSSVAASLGACVFAFALPVPTQDNHAQLVYRFAVPLAALALWQTFERRRLAELGRVAFFAAWQFYCSPYLGLFLGYLLAALAVTLLVLRRPFEWPRWRDNFASERRSTRLFLAMALLLAGTALAWLAAIYLEVSRSYGFWRSLEAILDLLPRPGSYLIADHSALLGWIGRAIEVPYRWEHQMFAGFGVLTLAAAGVTWGRGIVSGLATTMLITLALLIALTLYVGELSLYLLLARLPGIEGMRAVTRIILVMLLPLSVLAALGAEAVWRRFGRNVASGTLVLAILAALVIVEPLSVRTSSAPIAEWRARVDRVRGQLPPALPENAILLVRTASADPVEQIHAELDAMLLGQDLGRPVLNGYSAFAPPGYRLQPCASAGERLTGYARFAGSADASEYRRRLLVVDLGACPPPL